MSILASLVRAYDRLDGVPRLGFSVQNIGVVVSLNEDGSVATVIDWREGEGKNARPRAMMVPQPGKRTAGIAPNFLWDKSSYVLGVTAGKKGRTAAEHAAFKALHERAIGGSKDPGLKALLQFLRNWHPDQFVGPAWSGDMMDQNLAFILESDRAAARWIHERPEAIGLWEQVSSEASGDVQICLVTGIKAPVARLHPAIKGVWGGQSSGGSIVSFNHEAFESYGHKQGYNAPISEAAAEKYTTVLNRFLGRSGKNRIQIGDASTVFWADSADAEAALLAEAIFPEFFDQQKEDASISKDVGILLEQMRGGASARSEDVSQGAESLQRKIAMGVRFHVLGLSPNASRISVRFHHESDFGDLAVNYRRFIDDMRLDPPGKDPYPPLWRYLVEVAVLGKRENVPPHLAGEWMRSILSGSNYPVSLLSAVLTRIRSDGDVNALRVSILRAVLVRNRKLNHKEVPVAFDPENRNKGYLLGRLFALYEQAQTSALGRGVNATIKDKFYGSASATPRHVFPMLERGSARHLSKIGKERPGQRVSLEKMIGAIMDAMMPDGDPFPKSLGFADQAMFGLGYYHQRNEQFRRRDAVTEETSQ